MSSTSIITSKWRENLNGNSKQRIQRIQKDSKSLLGPRRANIHTCQIYTQTKANNRLIETQLNKTKQKTKELVITELHT